MTIKEIADKTPKELIKQDWVLIEETIKNQSQENKEIIALNLLFGKSVKESLTDKRLK